MANGRPSEPNSNGRVHGMVAQHEFINLGLLRKVFTELGPIAVAFLFDGISYGELLFESVSYVGVGKAFRDV